MFYIVMFDTSRNRCRLTWAYHVRAKNAKEAVTIARAKWLEIGRKEHQFHIHAIKARAQDPSLFHVVSAFGRLYTGEACIDKFIPTL